MKHKRFEENILVDEAYTNYGVVDKNADEKKGHGIAKHFAETLEYGERNKWYHQLPEEPSVITKTLSTDKIEELRKEASSALHGDTVAYETKTTKNGSSDYQWAKALLNKGTTGDRVAAATILIQDNPVYNLTALRNLVNNVKPAKKKDGIVTIDALSELLMAELLIPDTKLRTFASHALGHIDDIASGNRQTRRNTLKLWYYEDQLKELYGTYVEALNKLAHDSVEANKEKAVSAMSYLLMHHPEREKMLLTNIINKLGDPSQSVSSKVVYHLCQLLYNHSNMKAVVLAEIEKMLFRTNISRRAQYYGICFLNQFYLEKDDSKIAENLIRIYFSFFKASIKKGDINSRLMGALLTGVKRAFPFADKERLADAPSHVDAIHKLVHLAQLSTAIHALALLFYISDASKGTSDRFYQALYRKLTSAEVFNTTHSALLFSLIYKSLKQDKDVDRVAAFIKRLLQLCCYMPPGHACGVLFLISQVLKQTDLKEAIRLVWTKEEIKEEIKDEVVEGTKQNGTVDEANTIDFTDDAEDDTQNTEEENLVKDEEKIKIDLLKGDKKDLLLDDEEESYVDLELMEDGTVRPEQKARSKAVRSWHHARVGKEKVDPDEDKDKETKIKLKKSINMDKVISEYNPHARNPSFAGARRSAYMELLPLAQHYHPTVKLFAERVLSDQLIQYSGDPLKDFAGIRFLDRFVFKNPKRRTAAPESGGQEVRKVKGSHPKFAVRKNYSAKGIKSVSVTSASYLNEDAKKIPVDEKFLYDFLQKRRAVKEDAESDSDADSVTSEDFEGYLDSITGGKKTVPAELSDEELDFLADMEATKKQRPKKKQADDGEDLDSGGDDDDDGDDAAGDEEFGDDSDGELNISGDEDEPDLSADEDELKLEDNDEDDDVIDVPGKKSGKGKMKLKLKGKDDLGSLFASAEEFSTLLEDTASNKKQGSSQAVSNADNASTKQLAWEDNRNQWITGFNKKVYGKKGKGSHNNHKKFKSGNTNHAADKKDGKRKGGNVNTGGKRRKMK